MILGFILGLAGGVIFTIWWVMNEEQKEFEAELMEIFDEMEEGSESFTYDCLNDPDPVDEENGNHIPRIN